METVYLNGLSMGDIIFSLNALFSYAIQENIKIKVCCSDYRKLSILFYIFHYKPFLCIGNIAINSAKKFGNLKFSSFLNSKYFIHNDKDIGFSNFTFENNLREVILPFNHVKFIGKVCSSCFQLDPRNESNEKIVDHFGKLDSVCIGGIKTLPYLKNRLNHFDHLRFVARTILSSSYYFGIDAGVAHLAATLGLPIKIIENELITDKLILKKSLYDFFYKDVELYDRNFEKIQKMYLL